MIVNARICCGKLALTVHKSIIIENSEQDFGIWGVLFLGEGGASAAGIVDRLAEYRPSTS